MNLIRHHNIARKQRDRALGLFQQRYRAQADRRIG